MSPLSSNGLRSVPTGRAASSAIATVLLSGVLSCTDILSAHAHVTVGSAESVTEHSDSVYVRVQPPFHDLHLSKYLAVELSRIYEGMTIALPSERWPPITEIPPHNIAAIFREVAQETHLNHYQRHLQEPKKPSPKRRTDKHKPHVSPAKLLVQ